MQILGIIPARYASTRFPAKLLKEVNGKSILEMVYRQALKANCLAEVVVATDHEIIHEHVSSFGGKVVMTSPEHQSGTDRCAEALMLAGGTVEYDFVVNIQGDEPLMDPQNIERLCSSFTIGSQISSAYIKITNLDDLLDPNLVKVVLSEDQNALYFSRTPIPHIRGVETSKWLEASPFYKHLGLYGYRTDILEKIVRFPLGKLEQLEKLEQLRWLARGLQIKMVEVFSDGIGIDTEEDFIKLKQFLAGK